MNITKNVFNKRVVLGLFIAILSLVIVACKKTPEQTIAEFNFTDDEIKLQVNDTYVLLYELTDNYEVDFVVSKQGVISIEENTVTALAVGEVTVYGTVRGTNITDSVKVFVEPGDSLIDVTALTISTTGEINNDFDVIDFYLERLTDYQINIFLDNDLNLEINSIKVANIVYTNEEFTINENVIVINKNTSNDTGKHNIFVQAITYINNDEVVTANLENEPNINLFVQARFIPVVRLVETEVTADESIITIELTDREQLIDFSSAAVEIFVYENEELILQKELGLFENEIIVSNLKINQKYTYIVKARYDILDGQGVVEYTPLEEEFQTKAAVDVTIGHEQETLINFNYSLNANYITLTNITLTLDGQLIVNVGINETTITELVEGNDYELNFIYTYQHDGVDITGTYSVPASTFKLVFTDVIRSNSTVPHWQGGTVKIPTYRKLEEELRAVWISTVSNIDIAKMQPGEAGKQLYKDTIKIMLDNVKAMNMNAVFFQIRPMNDAFYRSELAPWSRYITGEEGANPGFDVLEFALAEAHARGIELHGWLNPYRVGTSETMLQGRFPSNFSVRRPDLLMQATNSSGALNTILDPGEPEVQTYITEVISEIMENYPTINGIHFDDYFYLDTAMIGANSSSPDYQTYLTNREYPLQSIGEFRRNSVTKTIRAIYEDVELFNETNNTHIKFGISPSGVWDNIGSNPEGSHTTGWSHLRALNADTKFWIEEGIIHYIIPQIYWDFNTSAARYANLVDWWSAQVEGTDVYLLIGMGPYRYRDTNPWTNSQALPEQLRYNQKSGQVSGQVFFTYRDIAATGPQPLVNSMKFIRDNYWTEPARLPWESNVQ